MEAGSAASGGLGWRLWALVPLVLLAVAVALVVSLGDRVVDLVGGSPPPADEFDVRRVDFREGEIRVLVRNPQRDDLTIAVATVDDAIVRSSRCGFRTRTRISPSRKSTRRTSNSSVDGGLPPTRSTTRSRRADVAASV